MICLGALACASRNRSTNKPSIAAGSCAILRYLVGVSRDSSSRFSVDLPAHWRAVGTPGFEFAGQNRHYRIVAQIIVVVEILISQRDAEHALADKRGHRVFDISAITRVAKAAGQATNQTDRLVRRSQKKPTGIRRHRPAVEFGHHGPALNR